MPTSLEWEMTINFATNKDPDNLPNATLIFQLSGETDKE